MDLQAFVFELFKKAYPDVKEAVYHKGQGWDPTAGARRGRRDPKTFELSFDPSLE